MALALLFPCVQMGGCGVSLTEYSCRHNFEVLGRVCSGHPAAPPWLGMECYGRCEGLGAQSVAGSCDRRLTSLVGSGGQVLRGHCRILRLYGNEW